MTVIEAECHSVGC